MQNAINCVKIITSEFYRTSIKKTILQHFMQLEDILKIQLHSVSFQTFNSSMLSLDREIFGPVKGLSEFQITKGSRTWGHIDCKGSMN